MAETSISWTEKSSQTVHGCALESAGCASCYAMRLVGSRLKHLPDYAGLTKQGPNGPVWTGEVRLADVAKLTTPLRWKRPSLIFLNSLSDLWMEDVQDSWIHRTFAMIGMAPWHTFQMLTKRPRRQLEYMLRTDVPRQVAAAADQLVEEDPKLAKLRGAMAAEWPYRHVHIGVSVEDKARKWRIDALRETPAHHRFLSLEPLLEPLGPLDLRGIDQVIVGGESKTSGRQPRPMPPAAAREIRDQCAASGVAFHFKQVGSNHSGWPAGITGKGDTPEEWPTEFQIQQPIQALPASALAATYETPYGQRSFALPT